MQQQHHHQHTHRVQCTYRSNENEKAQNQSINPVSIEMSKSSMVLFLLLILLIHLGICTAIPNSLGFGPQNVQVAAAAASPCSGTIGECAETEEMDSESNRRLLLMMGKKYISYETLKRDIVPCNTPGASYYRCDAAQANPYTRGCQVIAGCRNSITAINN